MNATSLSNRLFASVKRRSRKPDATKAKALTVLPELSEEEEGRPSCSSISTLDSSPGSSRGSGTMIGDRLSVVDPAERRRSSRRVVLTGAEGLSFEDFFPIASTPPRPAPAPPLYKDSSHCESSLDDINLRFSGLGISLDFPSPPPAPSSPASRRGHSPTPSVSSSVTSSTVSSHASSQMGSPSVHITPPTSDDESQSHRPHLMRAPTCKSHRASIIFAKSMPDLIKSQQPITEEAEEDADSDAEWFAQDISDMVTLSTPLPPSFPVPASTTRDPCARPDSILPPPHCTGRSGYSKPLPTMLRSQSPSPQLDPSFLTMRRKSFLIPDRPPPPPPIKVTRCSTSTVSTTFTMERETEELLAELASAALSSGFLGTGLCPSRELPSPISVPPTPSSAFVVRQSRPPPRISLPADINDSDDETPYTPGAIAELEVDLVPEMEVADVEMPLSPPPQSASVYSQPSVDSLPTSPNSSFSFELNSPSLSSQPDVPYTPTCTPERVLRSRWSSSTLGSQIDRHGGNASWMSRLHLAPSKRPKKSSAPPPSLSRNSSKSPVKRSFDHELRRRESTSSRLSSETRSDSGDSTASSGLRRKPIPIEIFMRT